MQPNTFWECRNCGCQFFQEDARVIRNYGHEPDELECPRCGSADWEEAEEDCYTKAIRELPILALMARRA